MPLQDVLDHIFVDTTAVYSRPVNIDGFNGVHYQATLLSSLTAGDVTISIERSNDQNNWETVTGSTNLLLNQGGGTPAFFGQRTVSTIGAAYVRFKLVAASGVKATVALSVNAVNL